MTLNIVPDGDSLRFTGGLNRDTLMLYSPFTLLNSLQGAVQFDFTALDQVDTAGLAWLLQQLALAKSRQISVTLCNVPPQLLSLAEVTAVRPLLPVIE